MSGKLIVITGPMFSAKTSELQRQIRRLQLAGKRCLVVKHASDTRYGQPTKCCTHDQICMPAIATTSLWDIHDQCLTYDVIGLDESQFFPEIVDFVDKMVEEENKTLIVAALDGTYEGKPFGRIHELLSRCDQITKLTAVCRHCGNDAPFTVRRPDFTTQVGVIEVIGADDLYESVCRRCRKERGYLTKKS
jgi:thymidine kinase